MDKLANILSFVTVAETGSFATTARRLRVANSVISKRIRDLEAHLGVALLERTTRRVNLTEAGHAYADQARTFLADLAEAEEHLRHRNDNPVGEIRIGAPADFADKRLGAALAAFLDKFPDVTVRLMPDAAATDIGAGCDCLIAFGTAQDPALLSRKLAESRFVAVASPAYLERCGRPQVPEDLGRHDCLTLKTQQEGKALPFLRNGRKFWQPVAGRLVADSGRVLCGAALQGSGIACLPTFLAGEHIVSGALEIVLEDFEPPPAGIYAVYPRRDSLRTRTRRLVEHLAAHFGAAGG